MASGSIAQVQNEARRTNGGFYTPDFVADWLTEQLLAASDRTPEIILDPACGDGALLAPLLRAFPAGDTRCVGIDIDSDALTRASSRIGAPFTGLQHDALLADFERADIVVANPPWGIDLPESADAYRKAGFQLASGQFDSYDLFVERALAAIRPGGLVGFIIPDSILLPEHERTRRLLLDETQLLSITRLGEGIFEGVYRGTVLIVARRSEAPPGARVMCSRLRSEYRTSAVSETHSLSALLDSHWVPLDRLVESSHAEFDIDVRDGDGAFDAMSTYSGFPWGVAAKISRGAEIGKHGLMWQCPTCRTARPVPRTKTPVRCACGHSLSSVNEVRVVDASPPPQSPDWVPLIVGSDVTRYRSDASRYIRLGVPGLRYKQLDPGATKLLVRKTGVGIQAAMDTSGAHTVQTVFDVTAAGQASDEILYFLLGVLNSRPLQAFHLRRSGDLEWRSHPYVTPKLIMRLPIPDPMDSPRLSAMIAELAREMSETPSSQVDGRLDSLVADLFGIGSDGVSWSRQVLASAQQLRAISQLLDSPEEAPLGS